MLLLISILIGLLILYMSQINYRKIYLSLKLPGPLPLPFIGNATHFVNKSSAEIWVAFEKMFSQYGDVLRIWAASELLVLLSNPRDIEVVLTSTKFIEKSEKYRFLKPWLNEGLLLSSGSKWHQRRKILTPSFHFKALEEYVKIFDRHSSVFVDMLSQYKTTDKVELLPMIELCTLDIICEAAMGIEMNSQRQANSEYVRAVNTICHIIIKRISSILICFDTVFRFTAMYKQQTNALKVLHGFTERVIQERRQKFVAQSSTDTVDKKFTQTTKTFLDILLQGEIDGKPLSNLDIREEVDTFMFEGQDTTSSALLFCFFSLARYPEIQQKCFQEIRNVLGDNRSAATCNDLNNLRYLDLVIKETLRLYPSVPLIGRLLSEELTIGNCIYPKGTNLGFSPVILGRNPELFQNPQEFRPERFLEDTINEKYTFSYLPFSAGPRNCIGQKFAILELKAVLSKVLSYFEISLAEDSLSDPVLIGELITTALNPINYHFKQRKH
ncbi:cytochrome P450 4d1-like [Bradysia coprophila]|uniref:cytochrome P450 4d1-like n=1 Tax=Bradysia coprophila TaxID=38358 RepID=UPI00187DD62B|nr:cytochrome P450 4d1-like [Bradysia coprophila]